MRGQFFESSANSVAKFNVVKIKMHTTGIEPNLFRTSSHESVTLPSSHIDKIGPMLGRSEGL